MNIRIQNKISKSIFISLMLLWMLFIFLMSEQKASDSAHTSGLFVDILNAFFGIKPMTERYFVLVYVVRKCAHAFEFVVLSALSFFTLCHYKPTLLQKAVTSFVFAVFYALTDEIHQIFVEGRACRFADVCIDALGSAVGICLSIFAVFCIYKIKEKKL